MLMIKTILFLLTTYSCSIKSDGQVGPDPWHYETSELNADIEIPPDLRMPMKRKSQSENSFGFGEWVFRRSLALILKGGQTKKNEDGTVDISLQMRFDQERWEFLDNYLESSTGLSEDVLRKAVGYIEDAIHKPTIVEEIVMVWSDRVILYLMEYKIYITWSLGVLAAILALIWLWSHMSHKHVVIIAVALLYFYEVIVSYKEAEQKELERFLTSVNKCKWYFWTSSCDIPPPDPLVFLKHMNPLKIGVRMFTTLISEPMVTISGTAKVIFEDVTDGLWFPFNKIVYGILIVSVNIMLILLLIMIVFNYILNIPFSLSLGLLSIGVKQRNRTILTGDVQQTVGEANRLHGATLDRFLEVCSKALTTAQTQQPQLAIVGAPKLRRSASTGRLPNSSSPEHVLPIDSIRKRYVGKVGSRYDGGGDAQ